MSGVELKEYVGYDVALKEAEGAEVELDDEALTLTDAQPEIK